MRARRLLASWLAALALLALAAAPGCGGVGVSPAVAPPRQPAHRLLQPSPAGPAAAISRQIVNGEKLALADVGGRVGRFKIELRLARRRQPQDRRKWDPGITAANAHVAAQDTTTIAYLGDLDSAATAISLPLINDAGILQVSPASPYVGLTSSLDAGQDEPERFYPSGQAHVRAPDARRSRAGRRAGAADARAAHPQRVRDRRPGSLRRAARGDRRRRRQAGRHRGARRRR